MHQARLGPMKLAVENGVCAPVSRPGYLGAGATPDTWLEYNWISLRWCYRWIPWSLRCIIWDCVAARCGRYSSLAAFSFGSVFSFEESIQAKWDYEKLLSRLCPKRIRKSIGARQISLDSLGGVGGTETVLDCRPTCSMKFAASGCAVITVIRSMRQLITCSLIVPIRFCWR